MERIGIMGGTFNPVHNGHLIAAEEARWEFRLDRVLFVPAGQPWQKEGVDVAPAEDRYLMIVIATAANPAFVVSRIELDRPGPTYAVDTLRELHREHPGAELFFITGADAVLQILTWKDPEDVLREAVFIAATRPGYDLGKIEKSLPAGLEDRVRVMEIPALAISSTEIRERVRKGQPIRYLVPRGIEHYIEKAGLYGGFKRPV
jgi:nicotinate-nucleotide adenylyltransferase